MVFVINRLISKFEYCILLSCALILISCGEKRPTVDREGTFLSITSFNLQPDCLKDGDKVELIYCGRGNDENPEKEYLIQVIAVKLNSYDTINILVDRSDNIKAEDGDAIFYFESKEAKWADKVKQSALIEKELFNSDSTEFKDPALVSDINKLLRVGIDPKFEEFSHYPKFPMVIGAVILNNR